MNDFDESMDIEIQTHGDVLVIEPLVEEITFKNSRSFMKTVKDAIGIKNKSVVMDMKHVEIIDSVSLGTLVAILKYVRSMGGDMAVAGISNQIYELFVLLNFQSVFRIFDTAQEAVSQF